MSNFKEEIINAEKRLGVSLPLDYVNFMKDLNQLETKGGYWYSIENLHKINDISISDYYVFEELEGTEFTEEDFKYLLPIFHIDSGLGYLILDIRDNGFGTFLVFQNEYEIEAKYLSFSEFLKDKDTYNELF